MKVAQVLCAAGPVDATTNQALAWRQLFDSWHWGQTTAGFSEEYLTNLSVSGPKLKAYRFYSVATPFWV